MSAPPRSDVLLSEERIRRRVAEIGRDISRDYAGRELVLIGVLKGAVIFLSDLTRAISIPHTFDLVGASSYGSGTRSSGRVTVTREFGAGLRGKDVLLVEDIYDTGRTLAALAKRLEKHEPRSIELCCFVVKDTPREQKLSIRYVGFRIADVFAVGYGLDHAERYRHLPYLAALSNAEGDVGSAD